MAKIITITNQKGGVGKTTTAVNLGCGLGIKGKRVLIVDLDPQGNTTGAVGVRKAEIQNGTYSCLINPAEVEKSIVETAFRLSIIPANIELSGAGIELVSLDNRESRLRTALMKVREKYDYILIDCPPSLDLLTLNGLCAADTLIIPMQCEFLALEGLSELMSTVRKVKSMYNSHIDIEGVLMTMYDGRLNLTLQVAQELKKFFKTKVYKTTIPRNVRLSEAPSYGQPIQAYDPSSKGCAAYMQFTEEFLKANG